MAHTITTAIGIAEQRKLQESRFDKYALVYSRDWTLCYVKEINFTNFVFEYKLVQKKDGKVFRSGEWQKEDQVYSAFV